MSNKWTKVGTNALENWNPENNFTNTKERKQAYKNRMRKKFKYEMKIRRMDTEKPKKIYKKDDITAETD